MFTPIHPRSTSSAPRRALVLWLVSGLLLTVAAAVHGQAESARVIRIAEPSLDLVPMSLEFDPAKATSVRTLGVKDPDKAPRRGGDKQPTPGWTTLVYETAEGIFPGDWEVSDNEDANGVDTWDDVDCRSFAGSWSIWCADVGNQPDCGNYDHNQESWMIMGPFSLADAQEARAEFRVWSLTERPDVPYDFLFWGASTDGANFHGTALGSNTAGWIERAFDFKTVPTLGDLRGEQNVWLAFVFTSDGTVNDFEGTYLDDIVIEKLTDDPRADLRAVDVFFRDQPDGGGDIVTDPVPTDVLYPHFSFEVHNESVTGRLWQIQLDSSTLCFFSTVSQLPPGSYLGSCVAPVSLTPGGHTLSAEVDPLGTIDETSEANNDTFRTYDVSGGCVDDLDNGVVCLFDNRFEFQMTWTDQANVTRPVTFNKFSHQSALGFYNNPRDIAIVVKVANGCSWNDHWWIWTGGASGKGAGWDLQVWDSVTGRIQTYSKPLGVFTTSAKDDSNFPCP